MAGKKYIEHPANAIVPVRYTKVVLMTSANALLHHALWSQWEAAEKEDQFLKGYIDTQPDGWSAREAAYDFNKEKLQFIRFLENARSVYRITRQRKEEALPTKTSGRVLFDVTKLEAQAIVEALERTAGDWTITVKPDNSNEHYISMIDDVRRRVLPTKMLLCKLQEQIAEQSEEEVVSAINAAEASTDV